MAAIADTMRSVEAKAAKERQGGEGRDRSGKLPEQSGNLPEGTGQTRDKLAEYTGTLGVTDAGNLPASDKGDTRDKLATYVGTSGKTLDKITPIHPKLGR